MTFLKKGGENAKERQIDVKTQESWESLMQKPGLLVVDVYATWCGPCKAIVSTFKQLKNEIGDNLLSFSIADTGGIDSLVDYRGKSEPTFLFYGDGQLVNVVRGCNCPLLTKSITMLLKKEHQILEGTAEREIFIDKEVCKQNEAEEKSDASKEDNGINEEEEELDQRKSSCESFTEVNVSKEISIVIIKPDAVKAGLVDEIIAEITSTAVEILQKEERLLSKEEAAEFYKQHEGTEHFEQLIEFMSSGPCMTLVISKSGDDVGHGFIPEFHNLVGPTDVNTAKEEAPQSLRAKYGTDSIQNALHSCDTTESAARELAFFYPDFNVPSVTEKWKKKRLQRTLALIRPHTLAKNREAILQSVEDAGFVIAMQKEVQLTREQAEEFYREHKDKDYFENLISTMISGLSLALCLAREDAVQVWRDMLGPKELILPPREDSENELDSSKVSLRSKFADPEDTINALHGADCEEEVEENMKILFPMETTVAVIKPDAYEKEEEREDIIRKIKEAGFEISAQKEVNLTKDLAAMFYKEHDGKPFFDNLTDYMSSGPTQFLILSREDAVYGFRSLMGPTVPEEAKQNNPNSLRAQYAKDEMKNAVHGSSSVTQAKAVILEFFPEVQMDGNGMVIEASKDEDTPKVEDLPSAVENDEADIAKEGNDENGENLENGGTEIIAAENEDGNKESTIKENTNDETATTTEENVEKENKPSDETVAENQGDKVVTAGDEIVWDPAAENEVKNMESHNITEEKTDEQRVEGSKETEASADEASREQILIHSETETTIETTGETETSAEGVDTSAAAGGTETSASETETVTAGGTETSAGETETVTAGGTETSASETETVTAGGTETSAGETETVTKTGMSANETGETSREDTLVKTEDDGTSENKDLQETKIKETSAAEETSREASVIPVEQKSDENAEVSKEYAPVEVPKENEPVVSQDQAAGETTPVKSSEPVKLEELETDVSTRENTEVEQTDVNRQNTEVEQTDVSRENTDAKETTATGTSDTSATETSRETTLVKSDMEQNTTTAGDESATEASREPTEIKSDTETKTEESATEVGQSSETTDTEN